MGLIEAQKQSEGLRERARDREQERERVNTQRFEILSE